MNKKNLRDKYLRNEVNKYFIKRLYYKYNIITSLENNEEIFDNFNEEFNLESNKECNFHNTNKLHSLSKNSSKVRIKNRCVISGRSKSVYKDFKLSRHMFRKLALEGYLPGVKKSSW